MAYLIASRIKSNIRELEGSLTRMIAFCALTGREMGVDLAQEVLGELWGEEEKIITIEQIQRRVCDFFGLKLSDLKAKNRTKAIAFPRQVAMYLARQMTHSSLSEIGRAFGGKDHTTVLHAVDKIQTLLQEDPKLRKTIDGLIQSINSVIHASRHDLHTVVPGPPSCEVVSPPWFLADSSRPHRLTRDYGYEVVSLSSTKTLENLMEVVLDRDAFLKGLQMVQNIVEPRQTLPILANVLLEAEGEAVRLTATDLEVGARVSVPAKVGSKGVHHGIGAEARRRS